MATISVYAHILYFYTEEQADKALSIVREQIKPHWSDYFDYLEWEKHESAIQFETIEPLTEAQMEIINGLGDDQEERDLNDQQEDEE
jgi:hypothetical protein